MRSFVRLVCISLLFILVTGCAKTVTVNITTTPKDARVMINGIYAGPAPILRKFTFSSPADMYRITATRLGYRERTEVITLDNAASKQNLKIELEKQRRTINLAVRPAAAMLFIDGAPVSNEPLRYFSKQLEFTTDAKNRWTTYTVRAERPNFKPAQITVSWDSTQDYTLTLEPMQKDLSIRSSPSDATVYLDDQPIGVTPLRKPDHPFPVDIDSNEFIPQKLRVTKAGYESVEQEIAWDGGRNEYEVALDPRSKTVSITTDPPDTIVRVEMQEVPRDERGVARLYLKFLPFNDQGDLRIYAGEVAERSSQGDWEPAKFSIGWDEGKTDYHIRLKEIQTRNVALLSPAWRHDGAWTVEPTTTSTLATKETGDGKDRPAAAVVTRLPKGSMPDTFVISPDGQQLLYTLLTGKEKNDFRSQMFMVKTDGSAEQDTLSDGKSLDLTPSFSPGGDHVVFSSNRAGKRMSIWQMSTVGAPGITQLSSGENNDLWPVIDSDPRPRLYYQSMIDNRDEPRLFSASLGNMFRTDMQISGMQPRVSPRNDAIAFTWINEKTGKRDIYKVPVGGGAPQNLTNTPDADDFDPVWNRDGSKLAFASDRGLDAEKRPNLDIWILDVNKSQPPQQLTTSGSHDDCPLWDPAGNNLYFRSNRGGEWGIWRMPLP